MCVVPGHVCRPLAGNLTCMTQLQMTGDLRQFAQWAALHFCSSQLKNGYCCLPASKRHQGLPGLSWALLPQPETLESQPFQAFWEKHSVAALTVTRRRSAASLQQSWEQRCIHLSCMVMLLGPTLQCSVVWLQGTRALYAPFESDLRSCSSDVYSHEMPGGQYTNLKFQVCTEQFDVMQAVTLRVFPLPPPDVCCGYQQTRILCPNALPNCS